MPDESPKTLSATEWRAPMIAPDQPTKTVRVVSVLRNGKVNFDVEIEGGQDGKKWTPFFYPIFHCGEILKSIYRSGFTSGRKSGTDAERQRVISLIEAAVALGTPFDFEQFKQDVRSGAGAVDAVTQTSEW